MYLVLSPSGTLLRWSPARVWLRIVNFPLMLETNLGKRIGRRAQLLFRLKIILNWHTPHKLQELDHAGRQCYLIQLTGAADFRCSILRNYTPAKLHSRQKSTSSFWSALRIGTHIGLIESNHKKEPEHGKINNLAEERKNRYCAPNI